MEWCELGLKAKTNGISSAVVAVAKPPPPPPLEENTIVFSTNYVIYCSMCAHIYTVTPHTRVTQLNDFGYYSKLVIAKEK